VQGRKTADGFQDGGGPGDDPDRYFSVNTRGGPKRPVPSVPVIVIEPSVEEYVQGRNLLLERAIEMARSAKSRGSGKFVSRFYEDLALESESMAVRKKPPARRIPKLTLFCVGLVVSNRKKSVAWYTQKLGLELVQDMGHWVTVGQKGGSGLIHLCQTSEVGIPEVPEPGVAGIELKFPGDFEAGCAALRAHGVKFSTPPKKEAWGWYAGVVDPDGNQLTLMPANQ
jgi:catechol 2,3-dioxygenase-like lactoylglutathione lyase family enzyme